ncbi:MAG: hypothetical protein UZ13_02420 [Chloroflexi bacterium OLB13]|nr:MAG: hypothetical protein UZ13_02420 [Chloroflexi bacterium OLB13]
MLVQNANRVEQPEAQIVFRDADGANDITPAVDQRGLTGDLVGRGDDELECFGHGVQLRHDQYAKVCVAGKIVKKLLCTWHGLTVGP